MDVSRFGGTGVSCLGYSVGGLLKALTSLLGIDREFSVILVGTDGAGSAFLESEDFDSCGLVFQGVFDLDVIPDGHTVKGCPVQDLAGVASFIKTHHTDIAILAVGSNMARSTAALLIDAGIRAVWNLTDKDIDMDPSVIVENAGILDSFHILNYRMNLRETDPSRQVCREP